MKFSCLVGGSRQEGQGGGDGVGDDHAGGGGGDHVVVWGVEEEAWIVEAAC